MNTVTRLSLVFILSLSTIFFCAPVSFGAPSILNYQGTLMNDQGNPVTGAVPMVFRIYATMDASPVQALWDSGTVTVAVVNGAFAIDLGDNSTSPPQPALKASVFSDDTRYLGITVNGQELVPRKRLASVPYAMNGGTPKGIISMWSGGADSIPQGWALCDGNNGTPDLTDRFILGAGKHYVSGAKGGNTFNQTYTVDLPAHSHATGDHTLTIAEMPAHGHAIGLECNRTTQTGSESGTCSYNGPPYGGLQENAGYLGQKGGGGAHNHGNTGVAGNVTQDITPPYYALCLIMKL